MTKTITCTFGILTAVLLAAAAQSQNIIVATGDIEPALARGAIVWDVRSADEYTGGHIPGAVNIGKVGTVLRDTLWGDYLPVGTLIRSLGAAGIDPSREIITYGRNTCAAVAILCLVHGDRLGRHDFQAITH